MWAITATAPRPPAAITVPSSNPGTITSTGGKGAFKKKEQTTMTALLKMRLCFYLKRKISVMFQE